MLRRAPVGVELVRAGADGPGPVRITGRAATPVVTVTGDPAELTMWAMGRAAGARVQFDGARPDIGALTSWRGQ
jgi:hypothetical protein